MLVNEIGQEKIGNYMAVSTQLMKINNLLYHQTDWKVEHHLKLQLMRLDEENNPIESIKKINKIYDFLKTFDLFANKNNTSSHNPYLI
jgi:hypothetical protein